MHNINFMYDIACTLDRHLQVSMYLTHMCRYVATSNVHVLCLYVLFHKSLMSR